jgi:hypothetical protein
MAMWEVALKARELFVGVRLGFTDPAAPAEPQEVTAGDSIVFNREGHDDMEGRILRTSSKGVVLEVMDLTRWLMTPVSYSEKRRSGPADKLANVWIVRERLP